MYLLGGAYLRYAGDIQQGLHWLQMCIDYNPAHFECTVEYVTGALKVGLVSQAMQACDKSMVIKSQRKMMLNTLGMEECTIPQMIVALLPYKLADAKEDKAGIAAYGLLMTKVMSAGCQGNQFSSLAMDPSLMPTLQGILGDEVMNMSIDQLCALDLLAVYLYQRKYVHHPCAAIAQQQTINDKCSPFVHTIAPAAYQEAFIGAALVPDIIHHVYAADEQQMRRTAGNSYQVLFLEYFHPEMVYNMLGYLQRSSFKHFGITVVHPDTAVVQEMKETVGMCLGSNGMQHVTWQISNAMDYLRSGTGRRFDYIESNGAINRLSSSERTGYLTGLRQLLAPKGAVGLTYFPASEHLLRLTEMLIQRDYDAHVPFSLDPHYLYLTYLQHYSLLPHTLSSDGDLRDFLGLTRVARVHPPGHRKHLLGSEISSAKVLFTTEEVRALIRSHGLHASTDAGQGYERWRAVGLTEDMVGRYLINTLRSTSYLTAEEVQPVQLEGLDMTLRAVDRIGVAHMLSSLTPQEGAQGVPHVLRFPHTQHILLPCVTYFAVHLFEDTVQHLINSTVEHNSLHGVGSVEEVQQEAIRLLRFLINMQAITLSCSGCTPRTPQRPVGLEEYAHLLRGALLLTDRCDAPLHGAEVVFRSPCPVNTCTSSGVPCYPMYLLGSVAPTLPSPEVVALHLSGCADAQRLLQQMQPLLYVNLTLLLLPHYQGGAAHCEERLLVGWKQFIASSGITTEEVAGGVRVIGGAPPRPLRQPAAPAAVAAPHRRQGGVWVENGPTAEEVHVPATSSEVGPISEEYNLQEQMMRSMGFDEDLIRDTLPADPVPIPKEEADKATATAATIATPASSPEDSGSMQDRLGRILDMLAAVVTPQSQAQTQPVKDASSVQTASTKPPASPPIPGLEGGFLDHLPTQTRPVAVATPEEVAEGVRRVSLPKLWRGPADLMDTHRASRCVSEDVQCAQLAVKRRTAARCTTSVEKLQFDLMQLIYIRETNANAITTEVVLAYEQMLSRIRSLNKPSHELVALPCDSSTVQLHRAHYLHPSPLTMLIYPEAGQQLRTISQQGLIMDHFIVVDHLLPPLQLQALVDETLLSMHFFDLANGHSFWAHSDEGLATVACAALAQQIAFALSVRSKYRIAKVMAAAMSASSNASSAVLIGGRDDVVATLFLTFSVSLQVYTSAAAEQLFSAGWSLYPTTHADLLSKRGKLDVNVSSVCKGGCEAEQVQGMAGRLVLSRGHCPLHLLVAGKEGAQGFKEQVVGALFIVLSEER